MAAAWLQLQYYDLIIPTPAQIRDKNAAIAQLQAELASSRKNAETAQHDLSNERRRTAQHDLSTKQLQERCHSLEKQLEKTIQQWEQERKIHDQQRAKDHPQEDAPYMTFAQSRLSILLLFRELLVSRNALETSWGRMLQATPGRPLTKVVFDAHMTPMFKEDGRVWKKGTVRSVLDQIWKCLDVDG